jgi:PleD family two-component response regulator
MLTIFCSSWLNNHLHIVHLQPAKNDYATAYKAADDALSVSKKSGRNKLKLGKTI